MKLARFLCLAFLILIFAFSTLLYADVPQMINYQGKITTPAGALVDSTLSMVFTLYHGQGDASPAWAETLVVPVEKGIFSVVLGNVHAIPYDVFDGAVKYLGVKAGTDPEMSPRKEVVSVGYAFKSEYSDTADYAKDAPGADCGWVDDGSVVKLETESDKVSIGTSGPIAKLTAMINAGPSGNEMAGYFKSTVGDNGTAIGVFGHADVGSGGTAYGVVGNASGGDSAWAGHFTGDLYASGDVGIGTDNPYANLHIKSSDRAEIKLEIADPGPNDKSVLTFSSDTGGTSSLFYIPAQKELVMACSDQGGKIKFMTTITGLLHEQMRITGGGKVGIGTMSPSSFLDVFGDINTSDVYKIGDERVLSVPGSNTFVGVKAGDNNTTGYSNTYLGKAAGYNNSSGLYNTFLGDSAGYNNIYNENTFLGSHAGKSNYSGSCNTFVGRRTGCTNVSGRENTFLGSYAGFDNTTGDENTFVGDAAGVNNTTGNNNTFIGSNAGYHNTTGDSNVFIGYKAGYFHQTGSNKLIIANAPNTSDILIYGDFSTDRVGINTTGPAYTLDVNGDINVNGSYNIKKGGVNYTHPDYVFEPGYDLMTLKDLRKYVKENKSLPNVISAEDVKKNDGFKMDELLIQMLEKIEEQTLYIFELEERIAELEKDKR
jgi:hypothetical protein